MADRYARVDVMFFHKRTCDRLHAEFGWEGVAVFLAFVCQVKTSPIPGTFIYESEASGWAKLGFEGRQPSFTLAEFFRFTGRIKQTSKTSVGRLQHVKSTHYERWQKDSRRYEEAARKSRKRAETTADTKRTTKRTGSGRDAAPSSRSRSTPKPPTGKNGNYPDRCPVCNVELLATSTVEQHLEHVHGIVDTEAAA